MKRQGWSGTAAVVAVAMALACLPAAPARAEIGGDSTGAAVTVGLMVAVVAVSVGLPVGTHVLRRGRRFL